MKAMRYLFYVLGAIVVLVVAGVVAVTMLFDANKLKVEIERVVEAKTGRTLKLEGDLRLLRCRSFSFSWMIFSHSSRCFFETLA